MPKYVYLGCSQSYGCVMGSKYYSTALVRGDHHITDPNSGKYPHTEHEQVWIHGQFAVTGGEGDSTSSNKRLGRESCRNRSYGRFQKIGVPHDIS